MITLMLKSKYCCLITTFQRCCFTEKLKKYTLKSTLLFFFIQAAKEREFQCARIWI